MRDCLLKLNNNALMLVLLPIMLIPIVFYKTTETMVHVWTVNETFTHGFLVLPLVLWLVWKNKTQLLSMQPSAEPRAFILLLVFLLSWLVSAAVDVNIIQQFSMVSIIVITVWIVSGRQVLTLVFFPLMFLYFAVPFGQVFIPTLMQYTANFTVGLVKMTGIPIYQDGLSFVLPTGSWSVVEECSGVRYLIASFFLGSIYAYLNYKSTRKRVIFIFISLIVPIVGNGLRAFGIVMTGHFSGMELAVGADHLLYGWVFFGVIIFLLFYAGSYWRDTDDVFDSAANKVSDNSEIRKNNSPSSYLFIIGLLVISLSAFSIHIQNEKKAKVKDVQLPLSTHFANWKVKVNKSLNWQPVSINPDAKMNASYSLSNDLVQLNIAYYQAQRHKAEAISSGNKITQPYGGDWKLTSTTNIVEDGKQLTESEIRFTDKKILVWNWYRVGRFETANPYKAKVLEAYNLIVEGRYDASVVSIATQFNGTKEKSRKKLQSFWQDSAVDIGDKLEKMQNGN